MSFNMFNAIRENKVLAKTSEFTVMNAISKSILSRCYKALSMLNLTEHEFFYAHIC